MCGVLHDAWQCLNKKAGDGRFYKKKGVVRKVIDKYGAIVKMTDARVKLQLDQVSGVHRGSSGVCMACLPTQAAWYASWGAAG